MVNLAEMLLKVGALKFGDFLLSSGKRSNVYVDIKLASTYPEVLEEIALEITKKLEKLDFDKIACVELGGVPIAVAVSLKVKKPLVIFRKQKKDYGVMEDRVGVVNEGEKFVLIEDVVTTGRSALSAVERIERSGGKVVKIFAVVDREESSLEIESLLKLSDLLKAKDFIDPSKNI
ncbi:MAG: orotate phosphoribosyltransferase [Archaeoglobaceae archaeon]|nr:orotate phosphoribosyltransferase [Archaeoglobaceae archaeon]MCX8152097.1 orotate phosphoribosyltransferase [Archaeoglobaceae archaeon]MDW8013532.1 orotate phosphoribosyltransferase [Archaeoglobaceae archaeon]